MSNEPVWHDSSICATWLIHTCDVTHPYVQPIADKVAQHLEVVSKNFQFSTRRTRILMGFIIYYLVLIVNPMGRILVRKFRNNLEMLCHPICNWLSVNARHNKWIVSRASRAKGSQYLLGATKKKRLYVIARHDKRIVLRVCRGKGSKHLLGATKRVISLFYIFWNAVYQQRFPLNFLKLGLLPEIPLKSTEIWRYRIQPFGVLKFPLSPHHSIRGACMWLHGV